MPKRQTWVVKLGGSLIGSPSLGAWLKNLRELECEHRIVVVPGGGPFAEVVRTTQAGLQIDDRVAHRMAVQGMRQFGLAINALAQGDAPGGLSTLARLIASPDTAGLQVWDPHDEALVSGELPEDWTATSDSIAVWLGRRLGATGTVLVKSRSPHCAARNAAALAAESFVDAHLPQLLTTASDSGAVWWVESSAWSDFRRLLAGEGLTANSITPPSLGDVRGA